MHRNKRKQFQREREKKTGPGGGLYVKTRGSSGVHILCILIEFASFNADIILFLKLFYTSYIKLADVKCYKFKTQRNAFLLTKLIKNRWRHELLPSFH
jgi:hypothetical protein